MAGMSAAESIVIDEVRPRDWRHLVRAACRCDVADGGYFDAQASTINLWCGPENKPAGWPRGLAITPGPLIYPRALVGTLTYQWPDDGSDWASQAVCPVVLRITCPAVQAWRLRRREPGEALVDWLQRREAGRGPAAGRVEGDEAWCRRQWQRLKQFAEVGRAR